MKVAEVLHTVGGTGETSYATNSWLQENGISKAKFLVQETIADLYSALLPTTLAVADLGCSSGPNAFMVISEIIDAVISSCRRLGRPPPELQFFLNDLPGNDFNTIFRSLPDFEKKIKREVGEGITAPFYVVGVPGSFYGRLFPNQSIHFMHSSYSVHWLSQVPQAFASIALNEGNIYIAKTSPPLVVESYLEQFRKDFSKFLKLRSEEIIHDGRMVLTILGRKNEDATIGENAALWELMADALNAMVLKFRRDLSTFLKLRSEEIIYGGRVVLTFLGRKNEDATNGEYAALWGLMADALNAMVSKGILRQEEVEAFNLPFYGATMKEVKLVIQNEGSFKLEREHSFEISWDGLDDYDEDFLFDNFIWGENAVKILRAATESMFESHFGEAIMDDLFLRFAKNISRHLLKEKTKYVHFVISLKKRERG